MRRRSLPSRRQKSGPQRHKDFQRSGEIDLTNPKLKNVFTFHQFFQQRYKSKTTSTKLYFLILAFPVSFTMILTSWLQDTRLIR